MYKNTDEVVKNDVNEDDNKFSDDAKINEAIREKLINPSILKSDACVRMIVYKCGTCKTINVIPDIPENSIKKCNRCQSFLTDRMIIGDSKNTDEYPTVAFRISGLTHNGRPKIQVLYYMECRDCGRMTYIPWGYSNIDGRNRYLYEECECHTKKYIRGDVKHTSDREVNIGRDGYGKPSILDKSDIMQKSEKIQGKRGKIN